LRGGVDGIHDLPRWQQATHRIGESLGRGGRHRREEIIFIRAESEAIGRDVEDCDIGPVAQGHGLEAEEERRDVAAQELCSYPIFPLG
jgi:hypothetical protein